MGTTLSTLRPPRGAKHNRKRLGRGTGTGQGTTAGRGDKGQGSRSGPDLGRGFEGGQMPLQRRLPKRGFKNPFSVVFAPVNLAQMAEAFKAGETVDPDSLRQRGLAARRAKLLKVLGHGELGHPLTVKAHAFSAAAKQKIEAAGGTCELLPMKTKQQTTEKQ